MIVFSKEFGSQDPFLEAIQAARRMAEHDVLSFCPHTGVASGSVVVGYVGTPVKYNCSVFGNPVVLAARCAGVRPEVSDDGPWFSSSIAFPAGEWGDRVFSEVFPPRRYSFEGKTVEQPHTWEMREPRKVTLKNLPECEIREIINHGMHMPTQSAEDRAREALDALHKLRRYWPA